MTKEDIINMEISFQCDHVDLDGINKAMDEYAKQQAVAFAIEYAKGLSSWSEIKASQSPYDRMDVRYDQFVKQQEKQ